MSVCLSFCSMLSPFTFFVVNTTKPSHPTPSARLRLCLTLFCSRAQFLCHCFYSDLENLESPVSSSQQASSVGVKLANPKHGQTLSSSKEPRIFCLRGSFWKLSDAKKSKLFCVLKMSGDQYHHGYDRSHHSSGERYVAGGSFLKTMFSC